MEESIREEGGSDKRGGNKNREAAGEKMLQEGRGEKKRGEGWKGRGGEREEERNLVFGFFFGT